MLEQMIASTLAGSLICLALLIFKNKVLSLLGGKALYYISLAAMLIFVLPLNIADISLPKITSSQSVTVSEFETAEPTTNVSEVTQDTATDVPKETPQSNEFPKPSNIVRRSNPITVHEILLAIWLLGFAVSMCRYFISYFRFKRRICSLRTHEKIGGVEIIKSPLISSPLVFGFFKPTLAIPEIEMNENDYRLAIKHELYTTGSTILG